MENVEVRWASEYFREFPSFMSLRVIGSVRDEY